jgi:hypothetical protein
MHCGTMLAAPVQAGLGQAAASGQQTAQAAQKKAMAFAAIGALVVLALFGGLFASGALRFGASQRAPGVLKSEAEQGPNSLVVTGQPPQPSLPATADKRYMPDDVRAWLEHLERIERKRMDMASDQVAKAMEMFVALQAGGSLEMLQGLADEAMGGPEVSAPERQTPVKEAADTAADIRARWRALTTEFNAVQPPAECVPIRNQYDPALRETGAMIGDILGAIESASTNREGALSALMQMRGKSTSIDKSALATDELIRAICDKYETRKWFDVKGDVGGGLLSKGPF